MQGVMGAYKIEKKFWENLPQGVEVMSWADHWCMAMVDWAIKSNNALGLAQVVEVQRAWQSIKSRANRVTTIHIVAD